MSKPDLIKGRSCRGCPWQTRWGGCRNPVMRSGRCGGWVWYVRGGKQFRHRYVKPKDPRTPGQLRCRARLGAASRAWSSSPEVTEAERQVCIAAGRRKRSRPRLGQSGWLTGQQYYVGRRCEQGREKVEVGRKDEGLRVRRADAGGRGQNGGGGVVEVRQPEGDARSTSGAHHRYTVGTREIQGIDKAQGREDYRGKGGAVTVRVAGGVRASTGLGRAEPKGGRGGEWQMANGKAGRGLRLGESDAGWGLAVGGRGRGPPGVRVAVAVRCWRRRTSARASAQSRGA